MPNTFLLPYDEELLELFNFVINNTDNFELETTINENKYKIYKTYTTDEYSRETKSILSIIGSILEDPKTNNSSKELMSIIVERKIEKKEDKTTESWGKYPIKKGYRNIYKIQFGKYLSQSCFYRPSKPCLRSEDLSLEFLYPSNWNESIQEFVPFNIDELRNNPQISFCIYRTTTMPKKLGFDYRRFNGFTEPSLKTFNLGAPYYSNEFTFTNNTVSHSYNEVKLKEVNESLLKGRIRDEDGFVIPPLYLVLSNPKYLNLYSDYNDFAKDNPKIKYIDIVESIDIRNTIAGELNSGIGFSKEQMRNFIDTINEEVQIDRPSSNNVLLKTNKNHINY